MNLMPSNRFTLLIALAASLTGLFFNAPLAMFGVADVVIKNPAVAQSLKRWSAMTGREPQLVKKASA